MTAFSSFLNTGWPSGVRHCAGDLQALGLCPISAFLNFFFYGRKIFFYFLTWTIWVHTAASYISPVINLTLFSIKRTWMPGVNPMMVRQKAPIFFFNTNEAHILFDRFKACCYGS